MIDMQPLFISTDDFLNYWGIDLKAKLNSGSNNSNRADVFLRRVEDRLMAWVDSTTFRTIPWDYFKDDYVFKNDFVRKAMEESRDYWKKAILEQAMYVFKNSDIGQDSGYDPEKGMVAPPEDLQAIEICRPCIRFLIEACLYNHNIKNRPRYTSFN